jgi:aspartyl-tRNA(Asn)/glutamyl-tRNA(Gln) amidotransferase subunit B
MEYDVVIGIENHCELNTKSKMFSSAPTSFGRKVNSCVNEVDLAHPGTLPCLNKEAVKKAIEACTALNLEIDTLVKFDRKNYYYSDLPKGFQITQQFHPIGKEGHLDINTDDGIKRIRINRIHMEEDTAKQFHLKDETLVDYNRAGTPLIEIVTEPDMRNGKEAAAYVEKLRQTLLYLGVSDVKMEEGSLRCDVNISLKPQGTEELGTKVEIKNLNSIANIHKAIEFEIVRQKEILENNGKVIQSTRRFDETNQSTVLMRKKEGDVDYKFFPEPNIFPIRLDESWIKNIQDNISELPEERYNRYTNEFNLSDYNANVLLSNKELGDYYQEVVNFTKNYKIACNWVIGDLPAMLSSNNIKLEDNPVKAESLAQLMDLINDKTISGKQAKTVFEKMLDGSNPNDIVEKSGMKQLSDTDSILKIVNEVLDEQPQSIVDFKNGKDRAIGFLVGQVMKKSRGQANPGLTNKILKEEIQKR